MWYVAERFPLGWLLLEGAGPRGGQWAAKGPGEVKVFSKRELAEEHIEMSLPY